MKLIIEILKFIDYVDSFYNVHHGIYPIASRTEIEQAIYLYITEKRTLRIDFDSIDRENVRAIIEYRIINNEYVDNLSITKLG